MALFLRNESTGKRDCGKVRDEIEGESSNFEFGDVAAVMDRKIRNQVISKCLSLNFRRKFVEKGTALTLQKLRELTRIMEDSEKWACENESVTNKDNSNEKENPGVPGLMLLL